MNRVIILREKIGKLPLILSHTGVTIRQEGSSAFVECDETGKPKLVNLPYLADDVSEELMDAIEGFLDHEVAHLLFTDFTMTQQARQAGFGALHGLLEDVRVEGLMVEKFPGTSLNLSETGRFFLRRGVQPALAAALEQKDSVQAQGVLMAPALRAWGGQLVHEHFMRDYWPLMQDVQAALGPLVNEISQCSSTADTYALAEKMAAALNAYEPEMPPPQPSPSAGGQPGESSCEQQPGGKPDLDAAPKFDDITEGQDASDGGDAQKGEGQSGGAHSGEMSAEERMRVFYRRLDQQMQEGFDEQMVELIGEEAVAAGNDSEYRVFSTDRDKIEPLPVTDGTNIEYFINVLESQVAHLCGPMQKNLERIITARSIASWLPARRSGRLHAASLSRLACDDTRVFRKKIEGKSRDVAVELVVDCSGSMEGHKIRLATQAAYALSTVLGRLNIAHEVIGFTTQGSASDSYRVQPDSPLGKERAEHRWSYARYRPLYMPILKGYNERMTANVRARFAWLPYCGRLSNNVDGECVQIAAQRLASRREKGKIMLVLSDGQPAADGSNHMLATHLKKVVKEIEASGITVVGMGIDTTAVKYYYSKHLVIEEIGALPTAVLKQLKELLAPD